MNEESGGPSRRDRRCRGDHARRSRRATFWQNIKDGRYSISDVTPDRWDPALYYDPDPARPGQDLLEDRRLGPRLRMGSAWLEAADPAAGQRRHGRHPEVGRDLPAPRCSTTAGPSRPLDTERTAVVIGNAMAGREPLPVAAAHQLPRVRAGARGVADASRRCPKEVREAILEEARDGIPRRASRDHRGHHARRAGEHHRRPRRQPVQPPRSQLRHRRGLRLGPGGHGRARSKGSSTASTTPCSPAASTATWARRPS